MARQQSSPTVIQHPVWLHLRFPLSLSGFEDLLAERSLDARYATVRRWVAKFATVYAKGLRAGRPQPVGRWHLHEMSVSIGGRPMYLWRAVMRAFPEDVTMPEGNIPPRRVSVNMLRCCQLLPTLT